MFSKQFTKQLLTINSTHNVNRLLSSTVSSSAASRAKIPKDLVRKPSQGLSELGLSKIEKISHSMKVYLERAQANAEMINREREEYELGKRHLANIMGYDYHNMTEKDIQEAIEYLLPSGIFSKMNRPYLLKPEDVHPKIKAADFDVTGRPFHCFAYTGSPLLYQDMHDIHEKYLKCDEIKDKMMAKGVLIPPPEGKADLTGSRWFTKMEYSTKNVERVHLSEWNSLMYSLERLANHPYSSVFQDFLIKFRKELTQEAKALEVAPITYTEEGRPYAQAEGLRKHCKAQVTVWGNGSGLFDINGYDISYFPEFKERQQILFPLLFTDSLNKVDIEAKVEGHGEAAQAGAIRHGISLALMSFVDAHTVEKMRLAGLITKDRRIRERKKVGQKSARKSPKFRPR